jgi:hypothetical protein
MMKCWNCGRPVPKKARVCVHCEADLTQAPSVEEEAAVLEMLQQMPPEIMAELGEAMNDCGSAEEFANRILVGPCPSCGSGETGDCEEDPEIKELLVGRCYDCGQFWCTECGKMLEPKALTCPCWAEEV